VCTKNPFYVLSAALFLAGLRVSFGDPAQAEDTWAMMSGLAGYTLLLAVTACLLVRFGNVWDDVRTVLLLVVLMFLATSVTFDEVLVLNPGRGVACYLGGLLFAVGVSEAVLRGIRLMLPAWFRGPYYLILALFFLYPLLLRPLVDEPHSAALMWGLFGFSSVAGLVFLTLLPAIRRGPDYVQGNGSPWPWPLYPWSLFGFLALAVPARAFLLCWSMQLLERSERDRLIFGPYFLVPFALVIAVLLLEMGLVYRSAGVIRTALAAPALLALLALAGHRLDPVYQEFLSDFMDRLGATPLFLTLLAAAGFYLYAALRGVHRATEGLTAVLAALAVVGPDTLDLDGLTALRPEPLLAAAALQMGLGLWRRSSWRCLVGASALAAIGAFALPVGTEVEPFRGLIGFHLGLLAMLIVGTVFDDDFARFIRGLAVVVAVMACLAVVMVQFEHPASLMPWQAEVYPLLMAVVLVGYGIFLGYPLALGGAALSLAGWLLAVLWRGYFALRQVVIGLDYLALSLLLFAVALLISAWKAGLWPRWQQGDRGRVPPSTERPA
jgi:hypothetical protein